MRELRLALALVSLLALPASAADHTPFDGLAFLLGNWSAEGGGAPGQATGSFTFSRDLGGHVVIRKNHADYPATSSRPASTHDDLMVIYQDGADLRADYYDSEGHVIRYSVTVPSPNQAVFVSDAIAGAPRFRLTYKAAENGLNGTFEIAQPGKTEFAPYLSWKSARR